MHTIGTGCMHGPVGVRCVDTVGTGYVDTVLGV